MNSYLKWHVMKTVFVFIVTFAVFLYLYGGNKTEQEKPAVDYLEGIITDYNVTPSICDSARCNNRPIRTVIIDIEGYDDMHRQLNSGIHIREGMTVTIARHRYADGRERLFLDEKETAIAH